MRHLTLPALSLVVLAGAASAQSLDISTLHSADDINVMSAEGSKIGEVEEILLDASGTPVAAVVEVGGFLDIGDDDIVVELSELSFENGNFSTTLTADEMSQLPKWDR